MRRFLISCAAGCLACSTAFAAPAAVDDSVAFNATMAHLDKGGSSLYYGSCREELAKVQELLGDLCGSSADVKPEMRQLLQGILAAVRILHLDAIQAMGSSTKQLPDGLTAYRSYLYTGNSSLPGVLFDLSGRENWAMQLPAQLPESTRLAFEYRFDFSAAWNSLVKEFAASAELSPEIKAIPAQLEAACRTAAGVELSALLKTLSGTWSLVVVSADPSVSPLPMLRLSMPDRDGVLFKLLQEKGGLQLTQKSAGRYSVVGLPLPVIPELVTANGTLTFYSDTRLESMLKGGLMQSPTYRGYLAGIPARGLGFFYVNIDQPIWNLLVMQVEEPMIAGFLQKVPPPVFCSVTTREKDGFASTTRSNWNISSSSISTMAILSGILLPALNEAKEKAQALSPQPGASVPQAPAVQP